MSARQRRLFSGPVSIRYRRPRRCSSDLRASSGRVSRFRLPCMTALAADEEAEGALGTMVPPLLALVPSERLSRLADMDAISLFSGAGGLDLGCEAAGFETVAVVEADETARETILSNRSEFFPQLRDEAVFTDILQADPRDLLER